MYIIMFEEMMSRYICRSTTTVLQAVMYKETSLSGLHVLSKSMPRPLREVTFIADRSFTFMIFAKHSSPVFMGTFAG